MDEREGMAYLLRLLARRDHAEAELRRKLALRKAPEDVADRLMERLRELRYIDDHRTARVMAAAAVASRKAFGSRLHAELARRGIPAEIAADAVAEVTEGMSEADAVASVAARKFRDFNFKAATPAEQRRVVAYLQRRGLSLGAILQYFRGEGQAD